MCIVDVKVIANCDIGGDISIETDAFVTGVMGPVIELIASEIVSGPVIVVHFAGARKADFGSHMHG